MARARKTSARVQKYVREDRFILTLTEGEADFILGILANIGGHPTRSPRKYADRLHKALESVLGYTSTETDSAKLAYGDIRFDNYSSLRTRPALDSLKDMLAKDGAPLIDADPGYGRGYHQPPIGRLTRGSRDFIREYGERYNPNA